MNLTDLVPPGLVGPAGLEYFTVTGYTGTSLNLTVNHALNYIRTTAATQVQITIPPTSSVGWVQDTEIVFEQAGAGQILITGGSGVTLNSNGLLYSSAGQYSVVGLKMVSGNIWTLFGDRG